MRQELIGKEMFAVDGVRSYRRDASKEWSGTEADFRKKAEKMPAGGDPLISVHRRE